MRRLVVGAERDARVGPVEPVVGELRGRGSGVEHERDGLALVQCRQQILDGVVVGLAGEGPLRRPTHLDLLAVGGPRLPPQQGAQVAPLELDAAHGALGEAQHGPVAQVEQLLVERALQRPRDRDDRLVAGRRVGVEPDRRVLAQRQRQRISAAQAELDAHGRRVQSEGRQVFRRLDDLAFALGLVQPVHEGVDRLAVGGSDHRLGDAPAVALLDRRDRALVGRHGDALDLVDVEVQQQLGLSFRLLARLATADLVEVHERAEQHEHDGHDDGVARLHGEPTGNDVRAR